MNARTEESTAIAEENKKEASEAVTQIDILLLELQQLSLREDQLGPEFFNGLVRLHEWSKDLIEVARVKGLIHRKQEELEYLWGEIKADVMAKTTR